MIRSALVFLLMSFFAFAPHSRAGILIEPYLGYSFAGSGDMSLTDTSNGQTTQYDQDFSTVTYGGRLGYQTFGLMLGIDYSMQSFDMTSTVGSIEVEDGVERSQLGIFVGYELPILLRAWATYYVNATMDGTDAPSSGNQIYSNTSEFKDGKGYALGVGFTGLPFISINLEYRTMEYDTYAVSNIELTDAVYSDKLDLSEILLSVSLPLNLF